MVAELLRGFGVKSQEKEFLKVERLMSNDPKTADNKINSIGYKKSDFFVPGWADTRWTFRKNITIDSTKVSIDLINFPVLIELYDSDLQNEARASGNDIMFADLQGNLLNHEIELYQRVFNSSHAHLILHDLTSVKDLRQILIDKLQVPIWPHAAIVLCSQFIHAGLELVIRADKKMIQQRLEPTPIVKLNNKEDEKTSERLLSYLEKLKKG